MPPRVSAGANGSSDLTLSGSLGDINATLASLSYQGNLNFNGSDTLTVLSTDSDSATDSDTVAITVGAVNDTPAVTGPGSAYSATEQTNLNIHGTGFSVTDVDAASGTMTATFTVGEGTLTLAAGDSGVSVTANNSGAVSFTGTLAQIDALLTGGSTGTIVYNNGSEAPAASTTITLTVNDGGNTGTDPGLTADGTSEEDSASQTINITATNDAPTLDNSGDPTMTTITEDDTNNGGMTVASLLSTGAGGDPISDGDGDPEGIAITSRVNGRGQWQYSIDGGTNWLNVGTVSDTEALLLRSTDLVRFAPDGQNGTIKTFEFRAWDQSSGTAGNKVDASTNGGSTAFSSVTEIATITTTDVNDAPVLDNSGAISLTTQAEDLGAPTGAVGTPITDFVTNGGNVTDVDASSQAGIAIIDADTTNGTWWYSTDNGSTWNALGSVSDSSARVLNASSVTRIYFQSNADFNGTVTDAITFRAWDRSLGASGSLQDASTHGGTTAFSSATETADITIIATNDDPTNAGSLPGDVGTVEDVLTPINLSAVDFSDVDAGSSDLTVTLSTSTGGELTLAADANIVFGGTATARTLTGTLAELNTYFNNTGNIQYLHGTQHTFGDNADTITVVINDGGNTGSGGGTDQTLGTVNVDITAVNDEEVLATNTGTTVAEGSTGTVITTAMLETTDVDNTDAQLVYTVDAVTGNGTLRFNGTALGLNDTFTQADIDAGNVTYDHDGSQTSADSFDFTVDDGAGTTTSNTFNFTVTNVNDAPVASSIEGSPLAYTENAGAVAVSSTISFSDVDDTNIESAVVQITGNYNNGEDVLSFADQNGITGVYDSGTGTWTLTGSATLAQYEAAIRSITYTNSSEIPDTATRTVSFTVNDGDANSNTLTRDIAITSVNDNPFADAALPSDVTITEDVLSNFDISSLNIGDVDDNNLPLTLKLNAAAGNLSATSAGGVTVTGSGTSNLELTGSKADLNLFINNAGNIQYLHPTANTNGNDADTVTVLLNDNGNTGTGGGTDQNLGTVNVDITAVNDAPVVTAPVSAYSFTEQGSLNIHSTGFNVADVDDNGGVLTAVFSVGEGRILIDAGDSGVDDQLRELCNIG